MAILKSTSISGTSHLQLPVGANANRPSAPVWTVVSFTSTGTTTWTVPANVYQVDVLVVGGGGGGGAWVGGGGGAGGVIYRENYKVTPGEGITVTVGVGGTGSFNNGSYAGMPNATNGGNSVFGAITALGGGHGGSWTPYPANSGASGGGNGSSSAGAAGTAGQGFRGGFGNAISTNGYATGGGGGAAAEGEANRGEPGTGEYVAAVVGPPAVAATGTGTWGLYGKSGDGGHGIPFNISGSVQYFGGGGGGGIHGNGASPNHFIGFGGLGGGGDGVAGDGTAAAGPTAMNGAANTGGGGGAAGKRGDYSSRGGNGGSGIVVVRYQTGFQVPLRPGAIRLNTQNGLEFYSNEGVWRNMAMPFKERTVITTGFMAGGYKDGVAWNNVNRIYANTDTSINLGDGAIARSFNYQSSACSLNLGYVFGSANTHGTASNYVQAFNMRTEVAYNPPITALANNRYNSGTTFQEHYRSWTSGGGAASIEEYNLTTETRIGEASAGWSTIEQWAMSHENYGIFYTTEDSRIWHFAARTLTSTFGGQPSAHHQQKSVQSKMNNCYAGNEGSYSGGNNLRRSNMYTRTTSGTPIKPITNSGEENFTMGQDWQYMLGMYNGAQNNLSWKFYYSTEQGFQGNSSMEPKGKAGASSGACFWRG